MQAKLKNKISYHLTICFRAENTTILFHVNETTNAFLHDLSRFFADIIS